MDFWMISRQNLKNDLLDLFHALDEMQHEHDWLISDHDLWYSESCPDEIRRRWEWTGLIINGRELSEHLSAGYINFLTGGVLSAVPKGTRPESLMEYEPYWEHPKLFSPDYRFQTPLTKLELICYDGHAWLIVCTSEFSQAVHRSLPQVKPADIFFNL